MKEKIKKVHINEIPVVNRKDGKVLKIKEERETEIKGDGKSKGLMIRYSPDCIDVIAHKKLYSLWIEEGEAKLQTYFRDISKYDFSKKTYDDFMEWVAEGKATIEDFDIDDFSNDFVKGQFPNVDLTIVKANFSEAVTLISEFIVDNYRLGVMEKFERFIEKEVRGQTISPEIHYSIWWDDRTNEISEAVMASSNWSHFPEEAQHLVCLFAVDNGLYCDKESYVQEAVRNNWEILEENDILSDFKKTLSKRERKEFEEYPEEFRGDIVQYILDNAQDVADEIEEISWEQDKSWIMDKAQFAYFA